MKLTEYGKLVRKARIDAGITMLTMAEALSVAPSFLSATEVGNKKIPDSFVAKVVAYFRSLGVEVSNLQEAADVSNEQVSIEGLTPAQQFLVAGFARTELTAKQIDELSDMLSKIQKGGL